MAAWLSRGTGPAASAPALYASGGIANPHISDLIRGEYALNGLHHGKPLYKKEGLDDLGLSSQSMVIYFWDDRDGEVNHGWWIGPREGDMTVCAFNPSNRSPGDLTVPESGWCVPHDGGVDMLLTIQTLHTADECTGFDFELRWEFLASGDGKKENWQPMKRGMNDMLEKRWAEGWDLDVNLPDVFYVRSNGFAYAIDSYSMVQCNLRTGRVRDIRRGEARSDATPLEAKAAQVEQLQLRS